MSVSQPVQGRLGSILNGKYRLESLLGEGGVGYVCAGTHVLTGRRIAIKLMHPEFDRNKELGERFLHEAQVAAQLDHPNIVNILDVGTAEDGAPFLVMEFFDGETLKALIKRQGKLDLVSAASILDPIMDALAFAHARGITHRDLKPDNIFLATNGRGEVVSKLLDFGVAKSDFPTSGVTKAGQLIGTPAYMAPEQIDGELDVGPAADVWALGLVLLETLSGERVYKGPATAIVSQIVTSPPLDVAQRLKGVPKAVVAVIQKAVALDRGQRWKNAGEMLTAFRAAMQESGFVPQRPSAISHTGSLTPVRNTAASRKEASWVPVILLCVAMIGTACAVLAATYMTEVDVGTTSTSVASEKEQVARDKTSDQNSLTEEKDALERAEAQEAAEKEAATEKAKARARRKRRRDRRKKKKGNDVPIVTSFD